MTFSPSCDERARLPWSSGLIRWTGPHALTITVSLVKDDPSPLSTKDQFESLTDVHGILHFVFKLSVIHDILYNAL